MNKSSRTSSDTIEDFSSTLTYIELVVIGTIMILICAVTIIGNALVMISFIMDKQLRTLGNYFLLSLAISDVMIATFSMPLYIAYLLIGEWTLGRTICDMWLAQDYTCSNASCMNLLMIGFDRYFSVTNPLKYSRAKRTPKRVGIMIGIVWIFAFLLWPPWIYAWPYIEGRRTVPEDDCYVQFLETNSYVTFITAIMDYYAPLTIMFVLYYKIWRATRRRNRYLADMDSEYQTESMCLQNKSSGKTDTREHLLEKPLSNSTGYNNNTSNLTKDDESDKDTAVSLLRTTVKQTSQMEVDLYEIELHDHIERLPDSNIISNNNPKSPNGNTDSSKSFFKRETTKHDKAARVLTAILLAFVVTTTPYNVLIIIKNLDKTHTLVPNFLMSFATFLFYVNSTINPLCYALANENFRKTYWEILTCSWKRKSKYALHNYSNKSSQSKRSFDTKYVTSFL